MIAKPALPVALVLSAFLGTAAAAGVDAPATAQDGEQTPPASAGKEKKKPKGEKKAKGEKEPEGWHRDGFALKKGKSKIALAAYAQEDFRHYDWKVKGDDAGSLQAPTRELHRLRVGSKGDLGKFSYEFMIDPRSSQKGARLKDTTVGYEFSKAFSVLAGHFKPPVSQDFLTAAGKTDFVDRSMIGSRLVPDRDWGATINGDIRRFEYEVGVFAGDGDSTSQSSGTSGAGRLTLHLAKGFQVAGSFMQGEVTANPVVGSKEPSPKGASGQTATKFTFWNRPHVNGTRRRIGADTSYARGPFRIQAEYLEEQEQRKGQSSTRQDIPDVRGRGYSVQASWVVTGEKKSSTVEPKKSIFAGGHGALELVARFDTLKFDDTGDGTGFAGFGNRARNIAPSGASAIQAGANYWASNFLKFQGSALWESYNDPLIAPTPGNTGRYFTLVGRVQVMLP